jgi:predicted permease
MRSFWQDLRYTLRVLVKSPVFSIVSITFLALGIAGPSTFFAVIHSILSPRSLAVSQPDQLYFVSGINVEDPGARLQRLSYPNYVDLRDQNQSFSGLVCEASVPGYLKTEGGDTQQLQVNGAAVSGNYFSMVGVTPIMGRTFLPEEDQTPGTHPVMVFSYDLWQRRFASDPDILNKTVSLNGTSFNVIGVAPSGFRGVQWESNDDFWIPTMMAPSIWMRVDERPHLLTRRSNSWLSVTGRLKPGVSTQTATAEMQTIARRLEQSYPDTNASLSMTLSSALELLPDTRKGVLTFGGAVTIVLGIILLIICANVGSLLVARAAIRQREIGIRLALGATRWRIIRQVLTESVLLAVLGGVIGLLLTIWFVSIVQSSGLLPPDLHIQGIKLDAWMLGFTLLLSLLTGIGFGLVPALQASRTDVVAMLKDDGKTVKFKGRRLRQGDLLIVSEVALAMITLTCAGLFIRSAQLSLSNDRGYDVDKQLILNLNPSGLGYSEAQAKDALQNLVEQVKDIPGIEASNLAHTLPLGLGWMTVPADLPDGISKIVYADIVSPNHFNAMGMRLINGRDFDSGDKLGAPETAIINEALARQWFPNQDPVGQRITYRSLNSQDKDAKNTAEIVGVVKDCKYGVINEQLLPFLYLPFAQLYIPGSDMTLVIRTSGDPKSSLPAVRNALSTLNKNLPVRDVIPLQDVRGGTLEPIKLAGTITGGLGFLALSLTAIGIYGMTAYLVSLRTREIGTRIALGARPRDVLRLVVGKGFRLTVIGVAFGLIGALLLTRVLFSLIYGLGTMAYLTIITVPVLTLIVVLIASYLPVRKVSEMEPADALRYE